LIDARVGEAEWLGDVFQDFDRLVDIWRGDDGLGAGSMVFKKQRESFVILSA
jgi:hypothetical protein